MLPTVLQRSTTEDEPLIASVPSPEDSHPLRASLVFAYFGLIFILAMLMLLAYRPKGPVGYAVLFGVPVLCATPSARKVFATTLDGLERISRHRALSLTLVMIGSAPLAAAFCWIVTVPVPEAHDEFSYLLAADTFAQGRLANPTHPMWRHFETMHVIQHPTYASKYPPAQGLVLALGQVLFGLPLAGAWIFSAIACAAVTWALYAFVPGRWALLGGLLTALSATLFDWNLCYWGGSVAMLAGALAVGAFARITQSDAPRQWLINGLLLGLGLGLFALSRPYEGFLIGLPLGLGLIPFVTRRKPSPSSPIRPVLQRFLLVGLSIALGLAPALLFLGIYNRAVTGSPWKLPYSAHDEQYPRTPHFLFMPLKPEHTFRHEDLHQFHNGWEADHWRRQRTLRGYLADAKIKVIDFAESVANPPYLLLALAALPWVLRRRAHPRLLFAAAALLFFIAGQFILTWGLSSHYAGAATVLFLAVLLPCLQYLTGWSWRSWPVGQVVTVTLVVLFLYSTARSIPPMRKDKAEGWKVHRHELVQRLQHSGGQHLILVPPMLPGETRERFDLVIYNSADIDQSPVVWARSLSAAENAKLLRHFAGRKVWLMKELSNDGRVTIVPFQPARDNVSNDHFRRKTAPL